jgi:hypothetical protein
MTHSYVRKTLKSARRSNVEKHGDNKYGNAIGWAKQVMDDALSRKRRALVEKMSKPPQKDPANAP